MGARLLRCTQLDDNQAWSADVAAMTNHVPAGAMITQSVRRKAHRHEMRACIRRATSAPSSTQRAKTEGQSRLRQAGTTPVVEKRPTVGLMPTQPQKCPGTLPGTCRHHALRWLLARHNLHWHSSTPSGCLFLSASGTSSNMVSQLRRAACCQRNYCSSLTSQASLATGRKGARGAALSKAVLVPSSEPAA